MDKKKIDHDDPDTTNAFQIVNESTESDENAEEASNKDVKDATKTINPDKNTLDRG
ncbi:MAG: hypothetical protein ACLVKO_09035 [Dysgonomonas sp.]